MYLSKVIFFIITANLYSTMGIHTWNKVYLNCIAIATSYLTIIIVILYITMWLFHILNFILQLPVFKNKQKISLAQHKTIEVKRKVPIMTENTAAYVCVFSAGLEQDEMTHCLDVLWLLILVKTPSCPTSACQSRIMTDHHNHTHHDEGETLERTSWGGGQAQRERVLKQFYMSLCI